MKNCLVIDLDRCSGCDSCVAACKLENEIDLGVKFTRVSAVGPTGTFPDIEMYWLPMQCQQCENPGCIEVCPTGASYRDEATGVVLVNADDCIGCETCLTGCPYNVRTLNPNTNVIEKCTLCFQRRGDEAGWEPACVHNCCCGARMFGDLDDPESVVSKAIAAAGEENVHHIYDPASLAPTTAYILHEKTAAWVEEPEEVERYEKK
ncbi:4Fe-4S dicluster domain-containing protein [Xiamenia xianingshaonis]|uniref:4Fe-4S dicluster domain-containing protein n=1 Tax=Xiamenia xianingshaonis TaxID=2682776 RepID=A0A9E6STV4_9ACTN|nr:4Fe-4S dicluster domain-containing protein [Xiamenia xianingshaonis]NHM13768.1 4Fe-4S dicluster domain-containing protein [Xiamenia xianingshaonis]QTU83632.1 4Fe-4S dicluster domain-containing protein [Xiamenia xianingshaonis]